MDDNQEPLGVSFLCIIIDYSGFRSCFHLDNIVGRIILLDSMIDVISTGYCGLFNHLFMILHMIYFLLLSFIWFNNFTEELVCFFNVINQYNAIILWKEVWHCSFYKTSKVLKNRFEIQNILSEQIHYLWNDIQVSKFLFFSFHTQKIMY